MKDIYYQHLLFTFLVICSITSCKPIKNMTIDEKANKSTKFLFNNLKSTAKKNILFGHQHATEYGHGWADQENRSDVNDVCGSHPAVIGIDFSKLTDNDSTQRKSNMASLKANALATYHRGGITSIAWHYYNPIDNKSFYQEKNTGNVVGKILPGGSHHQQFKTHLGYIAQWCKSVKDENQTPIPMIFRPFHEFDGGWFWWGKPQTTKDEFISLWKYTVSYLRDTMDVHNLIYAFSPDNIFTTEAEFLERYPGNEWVDLVGMDNYGEMGRDTYDINSVASKLKIISDFAKKNNKLAAFTETGLESIPNPQWWTQTLLTVLQKHPIELCYVLVWRNDINSKTHYYAPFSGQLSAEDFISFYNNKYTLFEKDLNKIYHKKYKIK